MLKKLIVALGILISLASVSYADTIYIKKLELTFAGKHIKDDMKNVHFGLNFFERSEKTYKRFELILPKDEVTYTITKVVADENEDESTIEKLLKQADLWLYTDTPEKAYHRFLRAKRLMLDMESENKTVDETLKPLIYTGLLRFEILRYIQDQSYASKQKKADKIIENFAQCSEIFKEFQNYLCVKTLQSLKSYELELQTSMQLVLKRKRAEFFTLLDKKVSSSKAAKTKYMNDLGILIADVQTLFISPEKITSLTILSNLISTHGDKITQFLKSSNFGESVLKLFDDEKIAKIKSSFSETRFIAKLRDFYQIVLSEKQNKLKELLKDLETYEASFKKHMSYETVGKVLNADIIEFKEANKDSFEEGIKALSTTEKSLYDKINLVRESLGLNPLIVKSQTLDKTAKDYMHKLIKMDTISHRGPDGSTPTSRAKDNKWKGGSVSENLYRGEKEANKPEDVLSAWLNSIDHLKNVVSKVFDSCGISQTGYNWCMMFGGP